MYVAQERRAYILRLLQQRGSIRSASLARELGVTDETIRTDLVDMQAQGLLQRVHGGARYILPQAGSDTSTRPDCQLVQLALRFIHDGMRVFLDADSLALVLVSQLKARHCELMSPSLDMMAQLTARAIPHQLICPGGRLDKESGLLEAPASAPDFWKTWKPELAILCPPALRSDLAAYRNPVHAAWARAAAEAAGKTLLIVPSLALTAHAAHAFPLPPGNTIITENNLPPNFNHPELELIPYISAADLQQNSGFDY